MSETCVLYFTMFRPKTYQHSLGRLRTIKSIITLTSYSRIMSSQVQVLLSIVCVVAEGFCFCWWNIVYKCIFLPFVMCVRHFSHGNFDIYDVYLNWISYIHSHVDIPLNCIHSLMHSRTRRCFNLSIRVDGRFILRMIHCRSLLPRSHWESKQGTLLLEVKSPWIVVQLYMESEVQSWCICVSAFRSGMIKCITIVLLVQIYLAALNPDRVGNTLYSKRSLKKAYTSIIITTNIITLIFSVLSYGDISPIYTRFLCRICGKSSNMKYNLVCNTINDHPDVFGASPMGATPTTSSFST